MNTSKYSSLYELIAQHSGCPISGKTSGTFCNFGGTADMSGALQVRVHKGCVDAGLAFDKANAGIAIAEYGKALSGFTPALLRDGFKNHYLTTRIDVDPLVDSDGCAKATGSILRSLRDALDQCTVFVE